METKTLSIIVPVYNVEKYLHRCLDSIRAQTFTEWECILVDDGSSDASGTICDEYAAKDTRFRVIHQGNAGPGAARNAGLDAAQGEWIGFVDSDDWIDCDTYRKALETAREKDSDLVQWELVMEYPEKSVPNRCHPSGFFDDASSGIYWRSVVYASIFKRKIIQEHRIAFPVDSFLSEDALFNCQYYLHSERCYYFGECLYHFRQNPSSLTHRSDRSMLIGKKKVIERIDRLLCGRAQGYVQKIKCNHKVQALLWLDRPDYELFRDLWPETRHIVTLHGWKMRLWVFLILRRMDAAADFLYSMARLKKRIVRSCFGRQKNDNE